MKHHKRPREEEVTLPFNCSHSDLTNLIDHITENDVVAVAHPHRHSSVQKRSDNQLADLLHGREYHLKSIDDEESDEEFMTDLIDDGEPEKTHESIFDGMSVHVRGKELKKKSLKELELEDRTMVWHNPDW